MFLSARLGVDPERVAALLREEREKNAEWDRRKETAMHIDPQTLVALGVGVHLLAALAKALWKTPKRQAQIDAIEGKVDALLAQVQAAEKTACRAPIQGEPESRLASPHSGSPANGLAGGGELVPARRFRTGFTKGNKP